MDQIERKALKTIVEGLRNEAVKFNSDTALINKCCDAILETIGMGYIDNCTECGAPVRKGVKVCQWCTVANQIALEDKISTEWFGDTIPENPCSKVFPEYDMQTHHFVYGQLPKIDSPAEYRRKMNPKWESPIAHMAILNRSQDDFEDSTQVLEPGRIVWLEGIHWEDPVTEF